MQLSALKKLLHLISQSDSQEQVKSSEEISEQSPTEDDEMQNSECEMQTDDEAEVCEEGEEDSAGEKVAVRENNRSHLTSSVPRSARAPLGAMTKGELAEIRALFNNMDDNEIQRLYKKVTKQN